MKKKLPVLSAVLQQLPLWVMLLLIWMMLWSSASVMTIVTGILLAIGVSGVFYLPPIELTGRLNPAAALWLLITLLADIATASVKVAGQALALWWTPRNSMVKVELHSRSDLVLTMTAEAISLVPGTVVVEVDRAHYVLYAHVLGTKDAAAVEKARREVLRTEARIVRAFGSRMDLLRIKLERERKQTAGGAS